MIEDMTPPPPPAQTGSPVEAPIFQATGATEDGYLTFLRMGSHEIFVMVSLDYWRGIKRLAEITRDNAREVREKEGAPNE